MSIDHFDRCIAWLEQADPADRVFAWLGMGHALAVLHGSAGRSGGGRGIRFGSEGEWVEHLQRLAPRLARWGLRWRMPASERDFVLLEDVFALPAHYVADLVRQLLPGLQDPSRRVRVRVALQDRDLRWLDPLRQRGHARLCISMRLQVGDSTSDMPAWPLRIGALEDGPHAAYAAWLVQRTRRNMVPVALGSRDGVCDLLLYPGDAAGLRDELLRAPLPLRAKMVLLGRPGNEEHLPELRRLLDSHGYAVYAGNDFKWAAVSAASLAAALEHGNTFDAAWTDAFEDIALPWLSDRLANATRYTADTERFRGGGPFDQVAGTGWKSIPWQPVGLPVPVPYSARPAPSGDTQRYLQQQSFNVSDGVERVTADGFELKQPARVRVRIAPRGKDWQVLDTPFPPLDVEPDESAELQVCLIEPNQLDEPLWGQLVLPPQGSSTEHVFEFTPRTTGGFEGRLVVLHRGRVVQTALLVAQVRPSGDVAAGNGQPPTLTSLVRARKRIDDLRERRPFDLAIVENHLPSGAARTVALSGNRAWVAGSARMEELSGLLREILSHPGLAPDAFPMITDTRSAALLCEVAKIGANLLRRLMVGSLGQQEYKVADIEYIQLVTAREGATLPLEFMYSYPIPDPDATVCASWAANAHAPHCPAPCQGGTRKVVCPRGFWGISKVIERHQTSGENAAMGHDFFLQSEPGRDTASIELGDKFLLAASHRLKGAITGIKQSMRKLGAKQALHAKNWDEWEELVQQENPRLILCLPHVEGEHLGAKLEISSKYLDPMLIRPEHVAPTLAGKPPLVFLLGCDTARAGYDYSPHVMSFRDSGAAIVVATNCIVDARQAAEAAVILARELYEKREGKTTLGECMRDFRRTALAGHLLLALGVVAYGDADWHITTT